MAKSIVLIFALEGEVKVLIGRGNQCEIRSNDISVSRQHA